MARDEEFDAIRVPLSETREHIRRRLHQRDGVMPLWLERELDSLARACFRLGKDSAYEAKTIPRNPWADDPSEPLVELFYDEEPTSPGDDGR